MVVKNKTFKSFGIKLVIFLSVLGPGLITANVDNDAGGIYTYSLAGAKYGFSLLWTLIPITIALIIVQEMVARMGVVTGKGLADLIREEYGFRTTFILMVLLIICNLGNTVSEFAGLASGVSVFHMSRFVAVPLGAVFVWLLVVKGSYRYVEKVFLAACVIYIAYPVSCFLAHPDWTSSLVSTIKPSFQLNSGYFVMLIGLVGTTIAPWMQFYLQSAVVEKGVKMKDYLYSRLDVIVGCIITDVVAFFIIVSCAATLYMSGNRDIKNAGDAAMALQPLAGHAAGALFAVGLINASLFSACILPLATAYYVCEGLGLESGINKSFKEAPAFYWLYTSLIFLGMLAVVLLNEDQQVPMILVSQVANGILLPIVVIFMLQLTNREDIMGSYKNGRVFNVIAWVTCIVMIILTALAGISTFLPGKLPV
jgi:Mn2+/Fe2+ NRAMP family transporter